MTAAADTTLALQLVLIEGFKFYTFSNYKTWMPCLPCHLLLFLVANSLYQD